MTKRIHTICVLLFVVFYFNNAFAQSYKSVEVDLGVRYNILTGNYSGGGIGVFLEPRYNLNDQFALGLRLGFDILGGTLKEGDVEVNSSLLSSYIITGDYMLVSNGNKRVFAGLGLGFSSQGSVEISVVGDPMHNAEIGTVLAIVPRFGVKLGLLKLGLDYSMNLKEEAKNFLGVNVGLSFGGRLKKD